MIESRYNKELVSAERVRGMTNKQEKCESICKEIAWLRAGKCCEITGAPAREGHHVFFGGLWKGFWPARYNPLFYVNLCADRHKYHDRAPHIDNDLFLEDLGRILFKKDPDRILAISTMAATNSWDPGPPDWDAMFLKLKKQREFLLSTTWMDETIEPEYPVSNIVDNLLD